MVRTKILAMVLAAAIIVAIVPAFGLVASAAEETPTDFTIAFNGSREGDGAKQISTAWGTDADLSTVWEGWSTSATNTEATVNGQGYPINGTDRNTIQFFRTETGLNQSNGNAKDTTLAVTTPGYAKGAEQMIIRWYFKRSLNAKGDGDNYGNFVFKDIDGNTIAEFFMDKNAPDTYPFRWPDEGALLEIKYVKNVANGNYDVTYSVNGNKTHSETRASVNGFKTIECTLGAYNSQWNHLGIADLMIYEAPLPSASTASTVKAALDALTVTSMTKGQKIDLAPSAQDEFDTTVEIKWASDNEAVIDPVTGEVTPDAKNVVTVALTPSTEFNGSTVTGSANTVTVLPAPLAGGEYVATDGIYDISSDNLLATSDGWTDGEGTAIAESTGFDIVHEGDVAYISAKDSNGKDGKSSLKGSVAIKKGSSYLIAVTAKNFTPSWIGLDYGDGEKVQQNTNSIFENVAINEWKRVVAKFTASSDTLNIASRWNKSSYESFELYELTEQAETLVSVKAPEAVSVATGETPVLPATVEGTYSKGSVKQVPVEWTIEGVDFTNSSEEVKVVPVTGKAVDGNVTLTTSVDVKVYYSYAVEGEYKNGGNQTDGKTAVKFPATTKDFTAEFDVVFESFGDLWIQFNDTGVVNDNFGKGCKVGLGHNASGEFRPVDGDGNGGRTKPDETLATLKTGTTYTYVVKASAETDKYSVALFDKETGEQLAKAENFGFRGNSDKIDVLHLFTNGGGSYTASNISITYDDIAFPETKDVTVKYYVGNTAGDPVKTVTKTVKVGGKLNFDAYETVVDDVYYKADAITYSDIQEDITEDVVMEVNDNLAKVFATSVFTLKSDGGDLETISGKWSPTGGDTTNGIFVVGWGSRVGYAYIPFDLADGKEVISAKLTMSAWATQGANASADVYFGDPAKINAAAPSAEANAALTKIGTIATKSNGNDNSGRGTFSLAINADDINKYFAENDADGLYLVVKLNTQGVSFYGVGYGNNSPYLEVETVDVDIAPADLTTQLGWDSASKKFTVNFLFGEGDVTGTAIRITPEGAEAQADIATETGVAISTDKTNRIYYAVAVNGTATSENEAKASVYSLVVEALKSGTFNSENTITEDQAAEAKNVIVDGGLYITVTDGNYVVPDASIFTAEGTKVTIDPDLIAAGIKVESIAFSTASGSTGTATVDSATGVVNFGSNVLNSYDVIYLEDIEFVFETVDESVADETITGELDFVEEV